ncbi:MAG: bifunctional folylpolyglutamate synthase/dihydrofolate synthase [Candidatus Brocadiia bacterium]
MSNIFPSLEQAEKYLDKNANYEQTTRVEYTNKTFNLARTEALLNRIGNPHHGLPVIHIAGTKGKGTTGAFIDSCLRNGRQLSGFHTSPHLVSIRERIRFDGEPIIERDFCQTLAKLRPEIEQMKKDGPQSSPTYFEILTVLALSYFRQKQADWTIMEVGLGGRLDSTNVVEPRCCVITPIGMDHTDKLGTTPRQIAAEKAGILKPGVPVIVGHQPFPKALEAIRTRARELKCPAWQLGQQIEIHSAEPLVATQGDPEAPVGWRFSLATPLRNHRELTCSLLGRHQVENSATAVGVLDCLVNRKELDLHPDAIRKGIEQCRWPGRVELLDRNPALILDAAHTKQSIKALLAALNTHFPERVVHFIYASAEDKAYSAMLGLISPVARQIITTQFDSPRAATPTTLASTAKVAGIQNVRAIKSPTEALSTALNDAEPTDVVCITGSFYLAGEIRQAWMTEQQ